MMNRLPNLMGLLTFGILILALSFNASAVEKEDLVGHWYGHGPYNDEIESRWLTIREKTGRLSVKVRYYRDGRFISEAMSIGTWNFERGVYIATYTATNARVDSPPQIHQYEVMRYDGETLEYRSIQSGQYQNKVYQVKRVPANFSIPKPNVEDLDAQPIIPGDAAR